MPKDNIFIIGFNNKSQKTLISQINDTFKKNEVIHLNGNEDLDLNELQNTHGIIIDYDTITNNPNFTKSFSELIYKNEFPKVIVSSKSQSYEFDISETNIELCFHPGDALEIKKRLEISYQRKIKSLQINNSIYFENLTINLDKYEVWLDDSKLNFTFKEYELLKYLASNQGRVFSLEALLEEIWSDDYFGGTRTVDVHIRRIRSKIDDIKNQFIQTQWNVGYRFRSIEYK